MSLKGTNVAGKGLAARNDGSRDSGRFHRSGDNTFEDKKPRILAVVDVAGPVPVDLHVSVGFVSHRQPEPVEEVRILFQGLKIYVIGPAAEGLLGRHALPDFILCARRCTHGRN